MSWYFQPTSCPRRPRDQNFLLTSRASTMSWYFQPTSCPRRPRDQNFLLTSRASTMSWYFQPTSCPRRPREQNFLPCLSLTVLQKILEGALKWKGPLVGRTLQRFLRKSRYL